MTNGGFVFYIPTERKYFNKILLYCLFTSESDSINVLEKFSPGYFCMLDTKRLVNLVNFHLTCSETRLWNSPDFRVFCLCLTFMTNRVCGKVLCSTWSEKKMNNTKTCQQSEEVVKLNLV